MIQFQENAHTEGQKDERTDRPYFIGPFQLPLGVQNQLDISQLSKIIQERFKKKFSKKIQIQKLIFKVVTSAVFLVKYTNKRNTCKALYALHLRNRYMKSLQQLYERRKVNEKQLNRQFNQGNCAKCHEDCKKRMNLKQVEKHTTQTFQVFDKPYLCFQYGVCGGMQVRSHIFPIQA